MEEDKRLFLLDAYALIFRAYYAFIKNPRINSKGLNTSAIFGFTNTLLELIRKEKPTHIAVAFDVGRETFRHQDYPEYKGNRDETPEAIRAAVPYIHQILEALKIPIIGLAGYEADDLIGTLAKKAEKEGYTTYMMTSDKDFAQLVTDQIKMYRPAQKGGIEIWGIKEVQEKFGVQEPKQVIDLLGMMGDAVDNIPGLPGVGEKTAVKFIQEYGSLENLLNHTEDLKGKMKENVELNKDLGLLSKKLATIETNAPIDFEEEKLIMEKPDFEELQNIFNELEFRRSLETLYKTYNISPSVSSTEVSTPQTSTSVKSTGSSQLDLFSTLTEDDIPSENANYSTAESVSHFYQCIDNSLAVSKLIDNLMKQKSVCFDTETTSLQTEKAELVGISFSWQKHQGYYVPFPENKEEAQKLIEKFKVFFESKNIEKIGHNLKYDVKVLQNYHIDVQAPMFDTMIAHYLINPEGRHSMDVLAETLLQYKPIKIENLIGKKGKNQLNFRNVDVKEQTEYAAEDADITFQLYELLQPEIEKFQLTKLFYETEMPLMKVLAEMEMKGITIDIPFLQSYSKDLEDQIKKTESHIYEDAGEHFNLNSPKQLGDILFDKLQLDPKAKKTKTGQYKTSEDVLSKLSGKHKIIEDILNYRQLQKLKSTYVDTLPHEADASHRVHTTYMQTVAATGRLASQNPNLQNIPIKTERGREVRKAFIPKNKDFVLISADYSQIELRLIAEFSKDKELMKAFINGEDIHSSTAAKIFNVTLDEVTREQRGHAKTVNFGIIYGVSAFGLSEQTNLSRSEAKELIDTYFQTYPSLKSYMDNQIEIARSNGYVETILGRKRYLRDINSANALVRGAAERNAINAPIQGSAADIIKLAMIDIQKELKSTNVQTSMLLQVHDELVFEVEKSEIETISLLIKDKMENAYTTEVPLIVEVGVGDNWLEAH